MNRRAWLLFLLVSFLWGIPYFLIKVAIEDLSPIVVVAGRIAIGALVLIPVAAARGSLAKLRGHTGPVLALSAVHILVPFTLITYGETHISSSLTGLLIAIEPAVIALLMARTEPLNRGRVLGLLVGFAGVAVLVGVDVSGDRWGLLGAAMVLLAALSYAVATILVQRRLSDVPAEALTGATTTISAVILIPFALLALPSEPVGLPAWGALAVLGVFCTAVALLAFYQLIGLAGANRAGLVTYLNPVVAVLLGVLLLDEHLAPSTVAAFALIAAGCWLSTRPSPAPTAPTTPAPVSQPAKVVAGLPSTPGTASDG
ncbi:DMT family transporter [Winogradskya consettensis]|uniref:Membrane protein n=1 Tax=Winogradskya consettensis TaxID=113560 RepID=A0A919VR37_9ACTN|nr:DMT family transporter [Actinoplanes consettensis]GIM72762.1 membrane protein [Actinoplanes consettensis]